MNYIEEEFVILCRNFLIRALYFQKIKGGTSMQRLVGIFPIIGIYVIYQSLQLFFESLRSDSMSTKKLGILVPLTDTSLYTYGTVFFLFGLLLCISPFLIKKIAIARSRSQK